mmetsp:Transcript_24817/g.58894  ORF Transcript_24817/g.58894 Transcript_24817/m.58894 type:complete len:436 (+) Transcript_24817:461-1768(+)
MKNRRSSDPCASGGGRGYLARTPPIPSEISFRSQPTETCCDDNLIDLDLHKSESSDEALKNSDDAVVPKPGEDQPRASIVETENEELVALKAKCARLQSELDVERDRADNKEAAFALLARKYDENLNEKSCLQAKFLHLQTEKNQQSLHMRILTREIELLKRGCQHRPSFSSESTTIANSRESVEELRSNSAIADQPASLERQYRRRVSVDVIERELAVLRGLDGEKLDSSKSEPLPRSHSIHDMIRMRRLARQASNVSSSNISEVTNPRSSAYNARRDSSSLRDSLRSCDISRGGSDNKSTSHSFRNSRVSWHNSKDSLTVDLSHDDGCSHDARYLESQNTVNFGTSLEGDDSTDALPSVGKSQNKTSRTSTFQANSSRPGIEKMDSLRTLRASNTLTASMTMTENSFQPSVIDGSNDTSDRRGERFDEYNNNE